MERGIFKPDRAGADAPALKLMEERLGAEPESAAFQSMKDGAATVRRIMEPYIKLEAEYAFFGPGEFSFSEERPAELTIFNDMLTEYSALYREPGEQENSGQPAAVNVTVKCRAFERIPKSAVCGMYFYVCTAGDVEECFSGNFAEDFDDTGCYADRDAIGDMEKFYVDMWGGAYLDALRFSLEKELGNNAGRKGLSLSESFGPGFYGMDISETENIAKILDFGSLGVQLDPSGGLRPAKSCCGLYLAVSDSYHSPGAECASCKGSSAGCRFCMVYKDRER